MPNVINLDAESGANYIGDDAQPSLTITNTSTGAGVSTDKLLVTSGATIVSATPITLNGTASASPVLDLNRKLVVSSPTVALLRLGIGSGASAPVFELAEQAFVSATTILFTTAAVAGTGGVRVKIGDNYGWIPIMKDAAFTAVPRG